MNLTGTITPIAYWGSYRAIANLEVLVLDAAGGEIGGGLESITTDDPSMWENAAPRIFNPQQRVWTNTSAGRVVWLSVVIDPAGRIAERADWITGISLSSSAGAVACTPVTADELAIENPSERNACGSQPSAADPVNVIQGNFWESWSDLSVSGRGPGLGWARSYSSSRASIDGPLGFGWSASYFMTIGKASGVATITQENGSVVRFAAIGAEWAAPGRVDAALVEHPDGSWTFTRQGTQVFEFSAVGRLTAMKDLSGNTTALGYTAGVLSAVTDSSGRALTVTWSGGRVQKVTGPSAVLATGASPTLVEVTYGYDGAGNLTTVTDPAGGVWTFGYDGSHRVTTVREPRHHVLGASAPVVENHYDTGGRVDWQEDRMDRRTTFSYTSNTTTVTDPAGKVVVYEHANGICTGIIRDPGANQSRWVYQIDPVTLGRTKVTDPNGKVTTATYDTRGRRRSVTEPAGTTTITYTPEGLPATITDAMNVTTTYSYDPGTDRLRTVSRPVTPGAGTATTTLNYGDAGNPAMVTSVVDARGKTWTMTYNANGDLVSSTDPTAKQTTWTYNAIGWPLSTVAPAGNAGGGVPAQHTTALRYNTRGEVLAVTDPLGAVTEYDRDPSGNVTAQRDPVVSGVEQTSFILDAAGELTTVTRPGGSTLTTEYWPNGQVKTQRDGATNPTTYTYDTQSRLSTVTDPAARASIYRYDAGGRVVSQQQPGGDCLAATKIACITYGYSTTDDLTTVDYSDPATADVTFTYDALHRRTTMTDTTGVSTWTWDSLGRLRSFADPNGTVTYTFTDNGAGPTTITYPGGKALGRTYDDAGRQITSTGWSGGTATYGYDSNSNPTTVDTAATSGVEDTAGYDRANRMTAATLRQGTTVLASLGYTRDPEGMVTSSTGTGIAGSTDAFTYGPFDQLATNSTGSFTYDAADNLTGFPDGRRQKFNPANELCYTATTNTSACGSAPTGAIRYDYDTRGNRTAQRPTGAVPTTLTYDQADRMTQAKVPSMPDGSGQYHDLTAATIWLTAGESLIANDTKTYQITGANSIPATGVESVVLRLHVASPTNYGTLTAFPTGGTANGTVAMYLNPAEAATNLAVSTLGTSGKVSVQTTTGTLLSVELVGWYGNANAAGGLTFEPVSPARAFYGAVTAGSTTPIPLTGAYGVPSTGVSAVAVVAHSLATVPSGQLTVYSGVTMPGSVTLLYDSGLASAMTIVPIGPDGTIKLHTNANTTAATSSATTPPWNPAVATSPTPSPPARSLTP